MDPVMNVTAQDLIEVASPDQGSASGYKTGKESLAQVGNFIATGISYAGLPTSDQTLTGAIAELDGDLETLSESITDAYDNTATYDVDDFCIYENTLYKCNTAISTPEDFDSTKWTQTTIMAEAGSISGTKHNMTAGSNISIEEAYYIEYPDYYAVRIKITATNNITAGATLLTDTPPLSSAHYIWASITGIPGYVLDAAVLGISRVFLIRNQALYQGDIVEFDGIVFK